jgi:hypothetical protein
MLMSHREALVTPRITASSTQRIEGELLRRGTSFRDKEAEKHNTDTQKLPTKGRAFASLRYGILAFYKDKQHCRTAVRDPVDSLHIDRLVAVRVLEEVGISTPTTTTTTTPATAATPTPTPTPSCAATSRCRRRAARFAW